MMVRSHRAASRLQCLWKKETGVVASLSIHQHQCTPALLARRKLRKATTSKAARHLHFLLNHLTLERRSNQFFVFSFVGNGCQGIAGYSGEVQIEAMNGVFVRCETLEPKLRPLFLCIVTFFKTFCSCFCWERWRPHSQGMHNWPIFPRQSHNTVHDEPTTLLHHDSAHDGFVEIVLFVKKCSRNHCCRATSNPPMKVL